MGKDSSSRGDSCSEPGPGPSAGDLETFSRRPRDLQLETSRPSAGDLETFSRRPRDLQQETSRPSAGDLETFSRRLRDLQQETSRPSAGDLETFWSLTDLNSGGLTEPWSKLLFGEAAEKFGHPSQKEVGLSHFLFGNSSNLGVKQQMIFCERPRTLKELTTKPLCGTGNQADDWSRFSGVQSSPSAC
ncbi:unnamed protein product [Pleuronectes platessa]|uniref:Uncharacterized protein n=1 Tax=Pleuronectes platessa TaxID=8262 RepID=A0A9N7UDB4_PLEPL|nr:unnamed protein product [Pleuronectes platessa]